MWGIKIMFEKRMPVLRSSVKNRFLQVTLFGLVLAGAAATLTRVAPSKAQEPHPINGGRLSLLVEQGFVMPSQLLASVENAGTANVAASVNSNRLAFTESLKLAGQFKPDAPFDATFTISGNARFDTPEGLIAVTGAEGGVIMTPPIVAGPTFGESFIDVLVYGQKVIENLRVATLEPGGVENLTKIIGTDDPGLIVIGDHYAVLDENKMRETTQTVTGLVELPSKRGGKTREVLLNQAESKIDEQGSTAALCIRTPFGPGWVNWHGYTSASNPWASEGWGYKPESITGVAFRADDLARDATDGPYRRSWGCGVAYKIPDSCTVDVRRGNGWSYCCNAAAWAAGHRVGFVSPSAIGGPNCPP
jgi:hypothetical protein